MSEEPKEESRPASIVDLSFTISMLLAENAFREVRLLRCVFVVLLAVLLTGIAIAFHTRLVWLLSLVLIAAMIIFCLFELKRSSAKLKEIVLLRKELKERLEDRIRYASDVKNKDTLQGLSSDDIEDLRRLLRMYESSTFYQSPRE